MSDGSAEKKGFNWAPLEEPVNAFAWCAEFGASLAKMHPKLDTPNNRHRIAWLLEMARLLPGANHRRPQILFTLGEAALDTKLRRRLIAILVKLDTYNAEALANHSPKA